MSRFLTPHAATLPSTVPFTGPETLERRLGQPFRARLGANESLFGPSPRAIAAMAAAAEGAWMYGDPENYELKQSLAAHHGCAPENIVVGGGIDGLLGLICRLTLQPGTPVVTSLGAYPTFAFHVAGYGGALSRVPYRGAQEDPEALLAEARRTGARLLYLANPDNPMGSHHPAAAIQDLVAALPPDTLLLLDEAYADLAPKAPFRTFRQITRRSSGSAPFQRVTALPGRASAMPSLNPPLRRPSTRCATISACPASARPAR